MVFKLDTAQARDLVEMLVSEREIIKDLLPAVNASYPWYVAEAKKLILLYESFQSETVPNQIDAVAFEKAFKAYQDL